MSFEDSVMLQPARSGAPHGKLKIFFVTEDDPLYVSHFFRVFLEEYPRDRIDITGITVMRAFNEPIWKTGKRLVRSYGALDSLRLGTCYAWAKSTGRGISRMARRVGTGGPHTTSVNRPDYIRELQALDLDLIVSVAAPEIFRLELLRTPRLGCLNVHSGRIPRYRGMMPCFWQVLHGEDAITITIHRMTERLDAGDVLRTRSVPVRDRDSLHRILIDTKRASARLLIEVIEALSAGRMEASRPDESETGYFSFPGRKDVQAFRRCGFRIL
jgi:methionyl-tRNA formyltransferase